MEILPCTDLDLVTVNGVEDSVATTVQIWENVGGRFVPNMLELTSTDHPIYRNFLDFCGAGENTTCRCVLHDYDEDG